jgi:ABC-type dipeptide/oligopeptide/nickel transport system ATPase component/ABC-type dipeptide/oligopeptide/nickel transport system permease subunit
MRSLLKPLYSSASGIAATALLIVFVFLAVFGPGIWDDAATAIDVSRAWEQPGVATFLGTDELGRDIFARTMVATRLSLLAAFTASLIAICLGLPLGLLASAFGPRSTQVFRSLIGVLIAFPALLTAMFVGTIIGIGIPGAVAGIGIAMAPMFARLAQTLTASITGLDYVAAARTMGIGRLKILGRHILPNVAEPLIISGTTSVGISILGISALSFLGLGARPPEFDWGGLLSTGLRSIYFSPMATIAPAVMIALAGITFSLLGEAIAGSFGDVQHTSRTARLARRMAAAAKKARPARENGTVPAPAVSASGAPEPGAGTVLAAKDLVVRFPSHEGELTPVRGVSFELAAGERAGIVGESGSGKSLTVLALAQLVDYPGVVSAERLRFLDRDVAGVPETALRKFLGTNLAMVFQNPMSSLNPAIRIGEQVAESSRVHRGLSAVQGRELAAEKLTEVGIPEAASRLRQYPHEFSGGMRQRAMIAMGLTETPKLIIADEPTTALDVTVQRQILDLLEAINTEEGTAILFISHDIAVITSMCDRVIVMYAGLVVED